MRRTVLEWFELRWPRKVEPERVLNGFRILAASRVSPIVVEAVGIRGRVVHRLALPAPAAEVMLEHLRAALPALAIAPLEPCPPLEVDGAVDVRLSTNHRPISTSEVEAACRAVLTALTSVREGESLVLQWQLVEAFLAAPVANREHRSESPSLLKAALGAPPPLGADARAALRAKRALPGWRAVARIGAHADAPARQRQLIQQVAVALRSAEAPGVRFTLRRTNPNNLIDPRRPWLVPMRLNIAEFVPLSGWPLGDTSSLPVSRQTSRHLAPVRGIHSRGRRLGTSTYPGAERPVALSVRDSLRHLLAIGPTGVGKSTLLLNLICQDMAAGRAVVVIEPKGDLVADVLARVPAEREADVVLVDPTDREAVVGVNPLAAAASSELVADQLLHVFHHTYAASWGPRTSDILHSSLLTLARTPGMSLAALPLLLSDANFRRRIVGGLDEPIVLQPFWRAFDAWTDAERTAAIAPVLNKIRPLIVRPSLRAVLGHASPRFDLRQVFTERKILLVNLAKGTLGPEASNLLGGLIVSQLWQTALERTKIAPERRHPVFVFVDEFQDYLSLPTDLSDALAQARGVGLGLTLAHQHLGQLNSQMRAAVLANARSKIVFQLAADDAKIFAGADSALAPGDFRSLGAFEAYAQLVADDTVQPWLSLRTLSASTPINEPEKLRRLSGERYGVAPETVDRELQELRAGEAQADLAPKRRQGGSR